VAASSCSACGLVGEKSKKKASFEFNSFSRTLQPSDFVVFHGGDTRRVATNEVAHTTGSAGKMFHH
jgi:hypothetical protein